VRLFIERARAVNKTLVATQDNAAAIARICVRVDGLPLALELAAARARVLTMEQLADRLEYDPTLLASASRTGLPQHQTMRATIDWSHDLLGEQEQVLLRRLSVFAGGWTLETAETVCSGTGIERDDVLELLTQLVDKSMAMVDARNAVARYRLLEPIRQYALERLELSGEAETVHANHATALLQLAEAGELDLFAGPDEIDSLERLEAEHDNLRAALRWALSNGASEAALRASAGLSRFWDHRGHFQEGCAWLEEALSAAGDAPARYRSKALNALAALCWGGGDAVRAQPIAEQALVVSREAGDTRGVAWALLSLGMIAHYQDRAGLALAWLEECVPYARQAGHVALLSLALTFLGRVLLWAKGPEDDRAGAALEESLKLAVAAQSRYATGHALLTLGDILWQQGDAERAIPLWQRALEVRWQLADARGTAGCLERLALGLAASDQFASAVWLFGAAAAQRNKLGLGLRHDVETDHAHLVAVARQNLGEAFARNWLAGQASTVDEAVTHALEATSARLGGPTVLTRLSQPA
jgi:tetratricopeptide (TPR) repeat protein